MQSYAPYQRESTVRVRGRALDAAQPNAAQPNAAQPNAALHAFVAALDVTNEAALIVDRSGTIVHANAACESLVGCNELVGRRLPTLYPLAGRGLRAIVRELHAHGVWRANVPLECSGTRIEVGVALSSVPIAPLTTARTNQHASPGRLARPRYFCLVGRAIAPSDASVLSAVGRVAGEIAHDFNNQIAVVINYSFILLRQLPDDSPLRAHVTEMQSAAWRASQVAQEMLGFGGQRNAEADDIDLNALLGDVQALFAYALREDTRLELRLGENLRRVRARRAHLEWLLVELASRMRATLGPIESFEITTSNSDAVRGYDGASYGSHGTQATHGARNPECAGSVLISVEARARKRPAGALDQSALSMPSVLPTTPTPWAAPTAVPMSSSTQRFGAGPIGLRGAELALAHAHGELTVQQLPDGVLRYRIRLPAV
jgi:nitrogen-specific signal transduction histidine kinase